ncbi:MAG: TRAP transporter small permease [Rhodospirillaceae bacterium]|nr:TRAP transporter small permease [Rhodospirillaceae bacterium]
MTDMEEAGAVSGDGDGASFAGPDNGLADSSLPEEYKHPAEAAAGFAWPLRIMTAIAALFMFAITALTFVDVTGRYVFNSPVDGGVEFIEFGLGFLIFSALPLVIIKRAQITVELFDNFMSAGFKRVREVIVLIASAGMIGFITERMYTTGVEMHENDDISLHLDLPMAPILFILCGLAAISFVIQIYVAWRITFNDPRASEPGTGHTGKSA